MNTNLVRFVRFTLFVCIIVAFASISMAKAEDKKVDEKKIAEAIVGDDGSFVMNCVSPVTKPEDERQAVALMDEYKKYYLKNNCSEPVIAFGVSPGFRTAGPPDFSIKYNRWDITDEYTRPGKLGGNALETIRNGDDKVYYTACKPGDNACTRHADAWVKFFIDDNEKRRRESRETSVQDPLAVWRTVTVSLPSSPKTYVRKLREVEGLCGDAHHELELFIFRNVSIEKFREEIRQSIGKNVYRVDPPQVELKKIDCMERYIKSHW